MKIPTYQQQINYQRVFARHIALAEPVKKHEISHADQLAMASNMFVKTGQAYLDFLERKRETEQYNKRDITASSARSEEDEQTRFSSPKRSKLYQFAQTQAFEKSSGNLAEQSSFQSESATDKLDAYFAEQLSSQLSSLENPNENLWVQDYAVLRQEVQHLEQLQGKQQRQDDFMNGCRHFVQTAGLIRTPGALKTYIENNLAAAQKEFVAEGVTEKSWQIQKQNLYQQAVEHNLEAALSTGEIRQAEQVYQHFQEHLPQRTKELWQLKLTAGKAQALAADIAPKLYASCISDDQHILSEKIEQGVQPYCQQAGIDKSCLCLAVKEKIQQELTQHLERESEGYLALLSAATTGGDIRPILVSYSGSAAQIKSLQQLAFSLQNSDKKQTDSETFNRLQYEIYQGCITQQNIDEAFAQGAINASDTLRLKSRCCLAQAGKINPKEKVLFHSVYRLCRQSGLDKQETEEAVYTVFSSSENTQDHLQATQELKKWLAL